MKASSKQYGGKLWNVNNLAKFRGCDRQPPHISCASRLGLIALELLPWCAATKPAAAWVKQFGRGGAGSCGFLTDNCLLLTEKIIDATDFNVSLKFPSNRELLFPHSIILEGSFSDRKEVFQWAKIWVGVGTAHAPLLWCHCLPPPPLSNIGIADCMVHSCVSKEVIAAVVDVQL